MDRLRALDISAKSAEADLDAKGMMPPEQYMLRLQGETRQVPAYAMVVAMEGKLGPALSAHTGNCARESNGIVPPPGSPTSQCGVTANRTSTSGTLRGTGVTLDTLARNLSNATGRTVFDKTDLTGAFDFELLFTPEPSADTVGPSLFTAVQEHSACGSSRSARRYRYWSSTASCARRPIRNCVNRLAPSA